jgi:hypothetical protein
MEGIELAFEQLRSLEEALSDLRETYKQAPSRFLARMIANAEAEIADRATQNRSSDATLSCSRQAITPEPDLDAHLRDGAERLRGCVDAGRQSSPVAKALDKHVDPKTRRAIVEQLLEFRGDRAFRETSQ